jgi:hypothetical protein
VERGHGRYGDGHRGRDGILEEGEGLRGLVAGAVGGGDSQGGAQGVPGVEGVGVRLRRIGRPAQRDSSTWRRWPLGRSGYPARSGRRWPRR